jgi:ubiquinone/menaquinone biosynthesis C-methylase UbiE
MADDVSAFYDEFTTRTMARYRIVGNARLDAAIELIQPYVKPGAVVADVGCGIGIVAEAIARHERTAKIIGLDLSPNNIRYAQETVREPNVRFLASSVTAQFDALAQAAGGPVDLVCMIDVIEHIPEGERAQVFADMTRIAAGDAVFVLTYPSPEFQRYRTEHDPEILQIIDNVIEFDDLYREFRAAGWHLESMRYQGIWYESEYVYLVLRRKVPDDFGRIVPHPLRSLPGKLKTKALRPYRRWKYERVAKRVREGQ